MLELLINTHFPAYFQVQRSVTPIDKQNTDAEMFSVKDNIDANGGALNIELAGYNAGTLNFRNSNQTDIDFLSWNTYMNQYGGYTLLVGERCDVILTDNINWIVFCELTETNSQYILPYSNQKGAQPGKRAKAAQQIKNSINTVMVVPEIAAFISVMLIKTGLFACRLPDMEMPLVLQSSFNAFNQTLSLIGNVTHVNAGLQAGFIFEQRIYPDPFVIS